MNDFYTKERWAVIQGDKVVPESWKRTGFTIIAQTYLSGGSNLDSPPSWTVHAKRIVACHNALLGVDDPEAYVRSLKDALASATASLRDLHKGWPERELHEPVQMAIERCNRLVPGWDM